MQEEHTEDLGAEAPLGAEARLILLAEYEKAQDSAEHHDDLVWTVTSLNWVGSGVLMGFVVSGLGTDLSPSRKATLISLAVVGILLSSFVWVWALQFRRIRNYKYRLCKKIEAQLGMRQHTDTPHPPGVQTRAYAFLMTALLGAWVLLVVLIANS
jgi:hypothetical protein